MNVIGSFSKNFEVRALMSQSGYGDVNEGMGGFEP